MNDNKLLDHGWMSIDSNRRFVETFQWTVIDTIASLVYPEYIRHITEKNMPTSRYLVPTIKSVAEIVKPESNIMTFVSSKLINGMRDNQWMTISGFCNMDEYQRFEDEKHRNMLQSVLDNYILPNVSRVIPTVIMKKFSIGIESNNGLMVEDYGIDIFENGIIDSYYDYIIEEASLSLTTMIMDIDQSCVTGVDKIELPSNAILSISNSNALCRTLFSKNIADDPSIMDLLSATVTKLISSSDDSFVMGTSNSNTANIITFI